MIIAVDIDNTITFTEYNNYQDAKPNYRAIRKINRLYLKGNRIIYWTSRGNTSKINHRELTIKQLQDWGCFYHELIFGKLSFDVLYDDKAKKL